MAGDTERRDVDRWASPARSGGFRLAPAKPLSGDERFAGTNVGVGEFWRWAFSDLASNVTRSRLAEFLVALAVGDPRPLREEWADYDVVTPEGVKVEVKSAAYLQVWRQWKPSLIQFRNFSGRAWEADTGAFAAERSVRADVFVFAVQTCADVAAYDQLDVAQWDFYVVGKPAIEAYRWRSANLAWVQRAAGSAVKYDGLRDRVLDVWREGNRSG